MHASQNETRLSPKSYAFCFPNAVIAVMAVNDTFETIETIATMASGQQQELHPHVPIVDGTPVVGGGAVPLPGSSGSPAALKSELGKVLEVRLVLNSLARSKSAFRKANNSSLLRPNLRMSVSGEFLKSCKVLDSFAIVLSSIRTR